MIDKLTSEAVELLERMIAIPSTSRDEKAVADMLQDVMEKDFGLATQRHGNNIWTISPNFSASKPTLLLNAHIDTVKPSAMWKHDPFTPVVEGDMLYGLGSNDDGASVVSLLQTFRVITQQELGYNVVFLASAEEEVSGKMGIESVLPLLPKIDVALVGEPTGMQPAIAEKGLMVIDATAHGKSGHAARNEGDNAIYRAIDDINWIRNLAFEKVSKLLGPVKATVTIVNAGTQHNVIPAECNFTIDVRSNECYSNHEIFDILQKGCTSELKARSFRLSSSHIPEGHALLKRAVAVGGIPFGSPTLSDQALMSFPSMKMGPGESSRSHTADEYICISEIREAIVTYTEMLSGLEL